MPGASIKVMPGFNARQLRPGGAIQLSLLTQLDSSWFKKFRFAPMAKVILYN